MNKKVLIILLMCFGLILLFPPLPEKASFTSVFRITDKPTAITRGTYGSALTINISFGDDEIEKWVQELEKPYPLLFIEMNWAGRYPETIRLINEKNIPTALFGDNGEAYGEDANKLLSEIEQFEQFFGIKPLWFRTSDEVFPYFLHSMLLEEEINALSSSFRWKSGEIPPMTEGEIISVPHHRGDRVSLIELKRLLDSREFQSVEDVLFGISAKSKKIPE